MVALPIGIAEVDQPKKQFWEASSSRVTEPSIQFWKGSTRLFSQFFFVLFSIGFSFFKFLFFIFQQICCL